LNEKTGARFAHTVGIPANGLSIALVGGGLLARIVALEIQ